MVYDWSRLGERPFENICRALAMHVLGPGQQVFGDGPDGGREAAFDGPVTYPTLPHESWSGYGVVQAKYRRTDAGDRDREWLGRQITLELDAWLDRDRKRVAAGKVPEYLIIATNVRLSSTAGTGGIDRTRTLLAGYADRLGLKGWALWDANQLSAYLDAYPEVAARFAEFLTPGDVLSKTFKALDSLTAPASPAPREELQVGQGEPGSQRTFQAAYRAAGGEAVLGEAASEVYDDGPGQVQHFAGGPGYGPAVVCARYEHPAVAVDAEVWDALRAAGPGQLPAVGYPVVNGSTPALITDDTREIPLDGGDWRAGRLVRQPDGGRRWQEERSFSIETRERDRWINRSEPMDLRLRAAARLSWQTAGLALDREGYRRVLAALRGEPLTRMLAGVAARLGLDTSGARWERTPDAEGYNDRRFLSYRLLVPGQTGRPALGLWARFQLPDGLQATVLGLLDLRLDYTALTDDPAEPSASPVEPAHRLDISDLRQFFTAGWLITTRALPLAAVPHPLAMRPAGPSTVEFHVDSERTLGHGSDRVLGLLDLLDLHDWGQPPEHPKPWMSTAVTAPLTSTPAQLADLIDGSLEHMRSWYGPDRAMTAFIACRCRSQQHALRVACRRDPRGRNPLNPVP